MEYTPAQLDGAALTRLQQFEEELRAQTDEEIIVVAYQVSEDSSAKRV